MMLMKAQTEYALFHRIWLFSLLFPARLHWYSYVTLLTFVFYALFIMCCEIVPEV